MISGVINLDNGWSCSPPRAVQESDDRQMHAIARLPAHRLPLLGVPADQIALDEAEGMGLTEVLMSAVSQR